MKKLLLATLLAVVPAALPAVLPPLVPAVGQLEYTTTPQKTAPAAGNVSVTPSGSNFAVSAWVEVIASTSTDIVVSSIRLDPAVTAVDFVLELAIGAASSEVSIAGWYGRIENDDASTVVVPIYPHLDAIPVGSRVSIRMRKSGTNTTAWTFALTYYEKPVFGVMTTTGASSTWLNGPSGVVTGASWGNGSYLQYSASMASDMLLSSVTLAGPSLVVHEMEFDVATGAAASEVVRTTVRNKNNGAATCTACGSLGHMYLRPVVKIASNGLRLALRGRNSTGSTATDFAVPNYYTSYTSATDRIATALVQKWYPAAANAVTVTPGTSSWNPGAWVELTAATSAPVAITGYNIQTISGGCSGHGVEIELGTGAAAAEVVRGTFTIGGRDGSAVGAGSYRNFPIWPSLNVPTGTRIAVRGRCTQSINFTFALSYLENPDYDNRTDLIAKTLPFNAAGVTVTPSGSSWGYSSWVELSASLPNDILVTGLADALSTTAVPNDDIEYELGTGAAAAEVTKTTIHTSIDSTHSGPLTLYFLTPHYFRTGDRLSVRMRKEGTSTTGRFIKLMTINDYTPPPGGGLSNPIKFCCDGWSLIRPDQLRRALSFDFWKDRQ